MSGNESLATERHAGRVSVESGRGGVGATFAVSLPDGRAPETG